MMKPVNQKLRLIICLLVYCCLVVIPAHAQSPEETEMFFEDFLYSNLSHNLLIGCPRYLLLLSSTYLGYIYQAETGPLSPDDRNRIFGSPEGYLVKKGELAKDSMELADIAKSVADRIMKERGKSKFKFAFPKENTSPDFIGNFKNNLSAYLDASGKAADDLINYAKAGNFKEAPPDIEKYFSDQKQMDALAGYRDPKFDVDGDVTALAEFSSPASILTLSRLLQSGNEINSGKERGSQSKIACEDCATIAELSKSVNQVIRKNMSSYQLNSQDPWLPYLECMDKQSAAFVQYYRTGEEKFLEEAYKYRKEATALVRKIWR